VSLYRHPAFDAVVASAIEVHRTLGPGLLESVYQGCLAYELLQRGIKFRREVAIPVDYKGAHIDCGFRADLLVGDDLIVEVKSVESLLPIHTAQVLTHLRLTGASHALLINFGQLTLKAGLRSFVGRGNEIPIDKLSE
jgi:GxxExxY protein